MPLETNKRLQTIRDFGEQWSLIPDNDGYYASTELLEDIFGPLLNRDDVRNANVAEIGSGSGRIVDMLLDCGAAHVTALEPSIAMDVLKRNTAARSEKITYVHNMGEELPTRGYDLIVSIGVLHHVPEPSPVVKRAYDALRPGGRLLVWLYGEEGNEAYLRLARPLRLVTSHVPDWVLRLIAHSLVAPISIYAWASKFSPLPMQGYMRKVFSLLPWHHRFLVIFDQLNPTHADYYTEAAVRELMETAGFKEVRLYHRHGYSWTALGIKPRDTSPPALSSVQ